ncbi:pSer/pThr/pTyr-binding forkhead associated (FHA) protein [Actinocorallia herbida]|uniref:PSer/pThr/pTyr-binding forkhead associated (FHA) protein n=1 Tax=Actinocorallia herbida TaxID=58109 RepID=A0A3N1DAW9_9ACTN|nr:FHA domain-containing protein [Actinocorallia herbida]ROO90673.1 pSer/pThr/pTyr-binding forkhead associated (FHA) protein [Actinocorallia herbida]
MTPITLTLIKIAFLAVLWLFVIAAVGVIRADLFGSKAAERAANRPPRPARQTAQERARQQRQASPPQQQSAPARPPTQPQQQQQPQGQGQAVLVVTEGPLTGTTIDLASSGTVTVGRAPDSTLVVSDDYASSRHARIYAQGADWVLEDLNSTNGTYLGRSKVTRPVQLPVGVPVRIGKTVIELRK